MHYNFSFLFEESSWDLSSLLHSLTYRFCIHSYSKANFLSSLRASITTSSDGLFKSLFLADLKCYKIIVCGLLIFFLHPAVSHVFHGPGFSGSRVWVQVLEVANLHSENYTYIAFLKKQCYLWKCYSSLHTFNNNMEIRKVTTFCKLLKENTWKCM